MAAGPPSLRRALRPRATPAHAPAAAPGGGRPALPRHRRRCFRRDRHPGRGHARRRQVRPAGDRRRTAARRRPAGTTRGRWSSGSAGWCRATRFAGKPRRRSSTRLGGRSSAMATPCAPRTTAPDPCRGLAGYVTTYQSVAAAPDLHLAAFQQPPLPAVRRRAAPPAGPERAGRRAPMRPRTPPGRARCCRCSRPPGCGC